MAYVVPNMTLIPQSKTMSCWYASAQMLVSWRRNQLKMTERAVRDPSEDPASAGLRDKDLGITDAHILSLAARIGLRPVPPVSPSEAALESWLRTYGPLWVNGRTHIVVIAGIRRGEVLVYDPGPVNLGRIEWRSLSGWYLAGSTSSRDVTTRSGVFLHCP